MDLTPDELRRLVPIGDLHAGTIADALIDALTAAYRAGQEDAAREDDEATRLLAALAAAENAQCGCLGGSLLEYAADQVDQPRTPSGCDGEDSPEERTDG